MITIDRPTLDIVSGNGRNLRVRLIEQGARFGPGDGCVHEHPEPYVEFFDLEATWFGEPVKGFSGHGQFITRRGVLELQLLKLHGSGLVPEDDTPEWELSADDVSAACYFAECKTGEVTT